MLGLLAEFDYSASLDIVFFIKDLNKFGLIGSYLVYRFGSWVRIQVKGMGYIGPKAYVHK